MRAPKTAYVVRNPDGLDEILARFKRGPLAVDTETSGLDWTEDLVGTINLASGSSALVALGDALGPVARFLGDEVKHERTLVFHHAKFDLHHLRRTFGLHVPYPVHDTAVQSFKLDNRGVRAFGNWADKPHGLKPLAKIFVDPEAQDHEKSLMAAIKAHGGKHKGDWAILLGTSEEHLFTHYSYLDPWYTLQLHLQFLPRIIHWPNPADESADSLASAYETERWLILALRDMEARGIMVNQPFLEQWRDTQAKKLEKWRKRLIKRAGKDINWNSHPQVREFFYGESGLGLTPQRWTDPKPRRDKKTGEWKEKGPSQPSTDEVALLMLAHPVGDALLEYREAMKLYSTYALATLEAICADGSVKPTFKQNGAATDRMSCEDPNLQNQGRTSGIREAYEPRKGLQFRMPDYSQIEMRLGAHFAQEPAFIKGFNEDPDFDTHKATAQEMYGVKEPQGEQRKYGKILNFTTIFGGGERQIAVALQERMTISEVLTSLKAMGYKRKPGETPFAALAHVLKSRYAHAMPNMAKALRRDAEQAKHRGYVLTEYGHHRYLEDDRWYSAFNGRVQGTAAGANKRGLVRVYREMQVNRGDLALLLNIHDELVYETEGDPAVDRAVLELMEETRFTVPIIADMKGSTTNWQTKFKVEL